MKLRKTTIFSILTLILALSIGGLLVDSIYTTIQTQKRIAAEEAKVVDALKQIRSVEEAYLEAEGKYTDNWDSLTYFLNNDSIYNIEKREIIIAAVEIRSVEEMYKGDSIRVEYDTLGSQLAKEKLFPAKKYPNFKVDQIGTHPLFPELKFEIFADTIRKSDVLVNVIEVVDPKPTDPTRLEDNENRKRRPLRFGSRTEVRTSGNWED